jgi:hypothetical protein
LLDQARDTATGAAQAAGRQARLGRKRVAAKRLEGKIKAQKLAIGEALYPLLARGDLLVDAPEAADALAEIYHLEAQLAALRAEMDAIHSETDGFMTEET